MSQRLLYFDCFSGISGDMTLGAFLDLGVSLDYLNSELAKLELSDYQLQVDKVTKSGIGATSVKVIFSDKSSTYRHLPDIEKLIDQSGLSSTVKSLSKQAFNSLAYAEASVHQTTIDKIHFHEVGAIDAIIDIVGSMICYDKLQSDHSLKVVASPLPLGSGFVKCEHGILPVPAPATAELAKGFPVKGHPAEGELVTPTGAVILKTLVCSFSPVLPEMKVMHIGYGAGKKDFAHPNLLRLFLGEGESNTVFPKNTDQDQVTVIETNLDDTSPETSGYAMEKLLENGALDVYFTPIYMKKNRPSIKLTVLCYENEMSAILPIIFSETSAIGVRTYQTHRYKLEREIRIVEVHGFKIQVKISLLSGKIVNIAPEFEDCAKVASKINLPLDHIYFLTRQALTL